MVRAVEKSGSRFAVSGLAVALVSLVLGTTGALGATSCLVNEIHVTNLVRLGPFACVTADVSGRLENCIQLSRGTQCDVVGDGSHSASAYPVPGTLTGDLTDTCFDEHTQNFGILNTVSIETRCVKPSQFVFTCFDWPFTATSRAAASILPANSASAHTMVTQCP